MSVIIGGDKIIAHSHLPPVVFDSIQEPGKRYVIADGQWTEIPNHLGYANIIHFKKPTANGKHHAFKPTFEQEVDGSKGKKYTVKCNEEQMQMMIDAGKEPVGIKVDLDSFNIEIIVKEDDITGEN